MSKVENINEYYRKLFNCLDDFKDSKEETEFFIYIIFKSLAFYQNKEFLPECKDSLSKSQKSFFSLRKKIFENLIDISFNESINDIYQFLNNLIDSEEEIFLQNYKRIFKHLKNVKKWNEEIYLKNFFYYMNPNCYDELVILLGKEFKNISKELNEIGIQTEVKSKFQTQSNDDIIEYIKMIDENKELKRKVKKDKDANIGLIERIRKLEEKMEKESKERNKQYYDLKQENNELKTEIDRLKIENAKFKTKINKLKTEKNKFKTENDRRKKEIDELKDNLIYAVTESIVKEMINIIEVNELKEQVNEINIYLNKNYFNP